MVDNVNDANNNNDNNNNNNNSMIVSDIDDLGPKAFLEPFQKENITFMRLLRRLKQQPEFRIPLFTGFQSMEDTNTYLCVGHTTL